MPRKSAKKQIKKVSAQKNNGFLTKVNWGESYTSLFLGAVVVVVALILVFSFLKAKTLQKQQSTQSNSVTNQEIVNGRPTTYVVKNGENLWQISEQIYKSGYNWVDIAKANKMENPGVINAGTKLVIPNVTPKEVTLQPTTAPITANAITGNSYTVSKGDYLWSIALRAYGDGYKWVEIAKANHLTNPNLIFSGNVLVLPR